MCPTSEYVGNQRWSTLTGSRYEITYISARTRDSNEIPKAIFKFSDSSYSMRIVTLMYDHAGSGELNMAAIKAEMPIHPLVYQIITKFQRLC